MGLTLPAIIRMIPNSAAGQSDLRNCSVDLLLMTLELVRVTVKDNQGSGTGGNFSSEPEMKMSGRSEVSIRSWALALRSGAMGTSLITSHLSVNYGETKRNKRKQKEPNQTVVFLKRVIALMLPGHSTQVFHVSILLFYAHVITLNRLYLSHYKFITCEAQVLSQQPYSEV